jgi:hypothetical protein
VDAAGDGEVLVVMDLRPDDELVAAGLAREVVNRVQRLRKKAGLHAGDAGEWRRQAAGGGQRALPTGRRGSGCACVCICAPASGSCFSRQLFLALNPALPAHLHRIPPVPAVNVYIAIKAAAAADSSSSSSGESALDLSAVLASQAGYLRESLGVPVLPASQQPAEEAMLDSEEHELGGQEGGPKAEFTLLLTRPVAAAAAAAAGGAADGVARQLQQQAL